MGLKGFVDWVDQNASDPVEERENDKSSIVAGFAARMHKQVENSQGETTPGSEVFGGKCPKRSGPDEEAQRILTVIAVDSPERASDALSALEGAARDVSQEACASLEDRVPTGGPRNVDRVMREAPLKAVVRQLFSARLAIVGPRRPRALACWC